MLWTVQEFALEQLDERGETAPARLITAAYWQEIAQRSWVEVGNLEEPQTALAELDANIDNVRGVLDWLEANDLPRALQLGGTLFWFWYVRGHHGEALRRLERQIELAGDGSTQPELARVLLSAGVFGHFQGRTEQAVIWLTVALERCRAQSDAWGCGFAQFALGLIAEDAGEYDRAAGTLDEAVRLLIDGGDPATAASARYHLAVVAFGRGDLDTSAGMLDALLGREKESKIRVAAWAIHLRGLVAHARGELAAALRDFQESLKRFQTANYPAGIDEALAGLAVVAMAFGDPAMATRLDASAKRQAIERGDQFQLPERAIYEAAQAEAQRALGDEAYGAEQAVGRAWTPAEAIAAGFAVGPKAAAGVPTKKAPASPQQAKISGRELDVLRLVAEGLSNDQVAERLHLSPRTVHAHLTTIYRKLGVSNRSEAARYAFDRQLF
jgi:ATP/maltotriose-dependent transcriptional regulator MalT